MTGEPVPKHLRNPRRAYDQDGREIDPPRMGWLRTQGVVTVSVYCSGCNRHVVLSTDGMPDDLAMPDIPVTYPLRCSACGSKRYIVMHDMTAYYDQGRVRQGKPSELPPDRKVMRLPSADGAHEKDAPAEAGALGTTCGEARD